MAEELDLSIKANIRLTCISEAIAIKQNDVSNQYTNKTVLDIAKELEAFVLGK
jgi:hypothetical protein